MTDKGKPKAEKQIALELAPDVKLEFVHIQPGTFIMGSNDRGKYFWTLHETPPHEVTITRGFYLGKYEVTRGQFAAFVNATGYRTDAESLGKTFGRRIGDRSGQAFTEFPGTSWRDVGAFKQTDDDPVVAVTWNDANAFCDWAAKKSGHKVRLPAEAEWEYACRAGSTARWSHGDAEAFLGEYGWFAENAGFGTHPVGQKKPNAWGLYDVHGNVWELVADWASDTYYATSSAKDPSGPPPGHPFGHVIRGGSWDIEDVPWYLRCSCRGTPGPWPNAHNLGFRAAVSMKQEGGVK